MKFNCSVIELYRRVWNANLLQSSGLGNYFICETLPKKWYISLRIISVNLTKSAGIWSHQLKKSVTESFIFCPVWGSHFKPCDYHTVIFNKLLHDTIEHKTFSFWNILRLPRRGFEILFALIFYFILLIIDSQKCFFKDYFWETHKRTETWRKQ